MSVQNRVRQFIIENFYVSDPTQLADDTSLITDGYVDSTGMLELITFLEQEYGLRVQDQEMIPENMETIGRITAFVTHKLQEA
jgi:acyl carrier protein